MPKKLQDTINSKKDLSMTKDKIQIYEVIIKKEGHTKEFAIKAKHHREAIKKFKIFIKEKANKGPHYSELFYGGEFLSYVHCLK